MVPVPVVGAWHEEQIDELFASLLGKGFGEEREDVTAGGFRLFG
jgi:protein AATF/BFR2